MSILREALNQLDITPQEYGAIVNAASGSVVYTSTFQLKRRNTQRMFVTTLGKIYEQIESGRLNSIYVELFGEFIVDRSLLQQWLSEIGEMVDETDQPSSSPLNVRIEKSGLRIRFSPLRPMSQRIHTQNIYDNCRYVLRNYHA